MRANYDIPSLLKEYYNKESYIPRVIEVGKLPITQACINLRIVERQIAEDKERQFATADAKTFSVEDPREAQLSNHSLPYEEYQLEQQEAIDIERIFEPSDNCDNPKKIAVYGCAGVGKSTLCRSLTVKWQEGTLWNDKFNIVIWLPLRDIVELPAFEDIGDYLANVVRNKCMNLPDTREEEALLPSINETREYLFRATNKDKILFILDGYDEVVHSMTPQTTRMLHYLLNKSNFHVIFTSRPIAINLDSKPILFDRSVENIGFTKEDIRNYIQKFYKGTQSTPEELIKFVESNRHIQNIARIPLNLELICGVWDSIVLKDCNSVGQNYTITQLYTEIIEYFFKFICDKKLFTFDSERKELLTEILGAVALDAMRLQRSILTIKNIQDRIQTIVREKKLNLTTAEFEELLTELLAIGVIKTISGRRELHDKHIQAYFIHHTFQEYFAAVYLAQGFESYISSEKYKQAFSMLERCKYSSYYEFMWIYTVGILYANYNKTGDYLPLFQFWDAFENEPRELLGLTHDNLKLRLINECPLKSVKECAELESISSPLNPLQKLKTTLISTTNTVPNLLKIIGSEVEPIAKLHTIEAIVDLDIRTKEIEDKLIEVMESNKEEKGVRLYAAESLLRLGFESEVAAKMICGAVSEYLKDYQLAALMRISETISQSSVIIKKVNSFLSIENNKERTEHIKEQKLDPIVLALKKPENIGEIFKDTITFSSTIGSRFFGDGSGALLAAVLPGAIFSAISAVRLNNMSKAYISAAGGPSSFRGAITSIGLGVTGAIGIIGGSLAVTAAVIGSVGSSGVIINVGRRSYNHLHPSISPELDRIALSNDENKLEIICGKVNGNTSVVTSWSKEGVLNLTLAIRLYSHSCLKHPRSGHTAWLEPMKEITFLYKDANIFLTINNTIILGKTNKIIFDKAENPLTKSTQETYAVLGAMRKAYEQFELKGEKEARTKFLTELPYSYMQSTNLDVSTKGNTVILSAKLIDHYLKGTSLSIITVEEKRQLEQRRIELAVEKLQEEFQHRPLEYTALHIAAQEGNIDKVVEILEQDQIDIDDQHNETGDTALMLAAKNKHWKIVTLLVERGADIAFCNKMGFNALSMAITANADAELNYLVNKCFIKESRLEELLLKAAVAYKQVEDSNIRDKIIVELTRCITGFNKAENWRKNIELVKLYHMYCNYILNSDLDCETNQGSPVKSGMVKAFSSDIILSVRLYIFIELYIQTLLGYICDYPEDKIHTLNKIKREIRVLSEALINENIILNFIGVSVLTSQENQMNLVKARVEGIIFKLNEMLVKDDFTINSGYEGYRDTSRNIDIPGHAIYVTIHKLTNNRVLVRVDNRYLNCGIVRKLHGREPWCTNKEDKRIKPYCTGVFNLDTELPELYNYIKDIILINADAENIISIEQKCGIIYGISLPGSVRNIPGDLNEYIENWPTHPRQTIHGRNCTISSYNLGILVRHGEEFFKWLKDTELTWAPTITPTHATFAQKVQSTNSNLLII
jgi:hypothetical protein